MAGNSLASRQVATARRGSAAGSGAPLGFQTFAGLPYVLDVAGAEVAVMGVPFDGGAVRRPGARFAPEAIRNASALLEPYHPEHGIDVFAQLRAVDWGDVELVPGHNARAFDEIEGEILIFLGRGVTPLALGGDGTILSAELAALASAVGPPALVMLDAHADSLYEPDDELNSRGGAVRPAVEEGQLRPQQSLIAGLRGPLAGRGELSWPAAMGVELIS